MASTSDQSLSTTNVFLHEESPEGDTGVSPSRKTKLVILKAQVSVDDNAAEEVTLRTNISSDSPNDSPTSTHRTRNRSQSPLDDDSEGDKSFASAITASDSYDQESSASLSKAMSFESISSINFDTRSMVTAVSGPSSRASSVSGSRSSTPTENLDSATGTFMRSIKAQLAEMEQKCATLETENAELRMADNTSTATIEAAADSSFEYQKTIGDLQERLDVAESLCIDYRDEVIQLKVDLKEAQAVSSKDGNREIKDLKDKLAAAESLCEELMEENETLKKEVQELQQEIEELQDQYREEEIEEFREIQRELEQTAKNCRILQFKLRKAERGKDQTEADRQHLEEKIKELLGSCNGSGEINQSSLREKELESELRIAKEVSVRLHNELESNEEKRSKLEDELFYLKERVREMEMREKQLEIVRHSEMRKHGVVLGSSKSSSPNSDPSVAQLMRDLEDSLERETDLKEQLKFAEKDIEAMRKKVSDLETENEGLMQQLSKFASPGLRAATRGQMKRSYSEGHAQIQLELAEHEAAVLKEKLSRSERDNEKMLSQISLLESELKQVGGKTSFSEQEVRTAVPDTYYKQKIKILEEEIDELKARLEEYQKVEADQDFNFLASTSRRSSSRLSRSISLDSGEPGDKNIDMKRQLSLIEQEANVLRQRISDLEAENDRLCEENKRMGFRIRPKSGSSSPDFGDESPDVKAMRDKIATMEKDIHRFIQRISDMEKEKDALNHELERRKKLDSLRQGKGKPSSVADRFNPRTATTQELREKCSKLIQENSDISSSLKLEQQKLQELESQLTDYKTVINQSENQKVVAMSNKVDNLAKELEAVQDRYETMHKKIVENDNEPEKIKYENALKETVERLEKELLLERSRSDTNLASQRTNGDVPPTRSKASLDSLQRIESQIEKLVSLFEQLDGYVRPTTTKISPAARRYKPAMQDTGPIDKDRLIKDFTCLKAAFEALKRQLKDHKKNMTENNGTEQKHAPSPTSERRSSHLNVMGVTLNNKANSSSDISEEAKELDTSSQDKVISDLKSRLEAAMHDKQSALSESTAATERLLQTEERWNKELEKLKESYENQVTDLKFHLRETDCVREEKASLLQEKIAILNEKAKKLTDMENRALKAENELKTKHKDLENRLESERKRALEFQTKYQKLEELYEADRQKLSTEKEKFKNDLQDMKKKNDDILTDFEKVKSTFERKQSMWIREKKDFEATIRKLQDEIKETEMKASRRASEMASVENKKLLNELSDLRRKHEGELEKWQKERLNLETQVEQKVKDLESLSDQEERLKKETTLLKSRIDDQKEQLEETRRVRDEAREELSRWQQTWTRERSELAHKLRQEEKVQQAEHQALQLKYESRIKVMEDSSKRIQAQLAQTRHERDQHRDMLQKSEKKLTELREKHDTEEEKLQKKLMELEKAADTVADLQEQLERQDVELKSLKTTSEQDQSLWEIEKQKLIGKISSLESTELITDARASNGLPHTDDSDKLLQLSMKTSKELRQHLDEVRGQFENEIIKLKRHFENTRKEWSKERQDLQRKIRDLQEQVKISEIDRRNMLSTKDDSEYDRSCLINERDVILQRVHDTEIHQLANKYKLDKVADQMNDINSKIRYGDIQNNDKSELQECMRKALEQLLSVREDMAKTKELGKAIEATDSQGIGHYRDKAGTPSDISLISVDGDLALKERLTPIGSERVSPAPNRSVPTTTPARLHPDDRSESRDDSISISLSERQKPDIKRSDSEDSEVCRYTSMGPIKSLSACVSGSEGFEARIAELHQRMRTPSPAPRKITSYPNPPPSFLLGSRKIEVDSQGRRKWAKQSILRRSISMDPTPSDALAAINAAHADDIKSHVRSSSTDTAGGYAHAAPTPTTLATTGLTVSHSSQTAAIEGTTIAGKPPKPKMKSSNRVQQMVDLFGTLKKSEASERRKKFGKKPSSIETSDTGHAIGAVGVQVLTPGVDPAALPDDVSRTPYLVKSASTQSQESMESSSKRHSGPKFLGRFRSKAAQSLMRHSQSTDDPNSIGSASSIEPPSAGHSTYDISGFSVSTRPSYRTNSHEDVIRSARSFSLTEPTSVAKNSVKHNVPQVVSPTTSIPISHYPTSHFQKLRIFAKFEQHSSEYIV